MLKQISIEEAFRLLDAYKWNPGIEKVTLEESLDRVLAEDIRATLPVPPFRKSPFDGYACRAADLPGCLSVVGEAVAGTGLLPVMGPGETVRIFTGAPVPDGADVVLKQEDVEAEAGKIRVSFAPETGTNVICPGEDLPCGALLLSKGSRLLPAHLGVLASQGINRIPVFLRPLAVIIPTGSELSEPGEARSSYGIYNSSYYALSGYLRRLGFRVKNMGIVRDEAEPTQHAVQAALDSEADIVITTGGASVGDYDFAESTARGIGAEQLFWKVNMKPGGALLVSRYGEKLLLSLSGNPAAALMSMLVVLLPCLSRLTGEKLERQRLRLRLLRDMPKTSNSVRLLRGQLEIRDGKAYFSEHNGRGNGNIASFADCELIGVIPGNTPPLKAGDEIEAIRLPAALI